jgi:glycosyltransferase involved in cell wall biosynthesis
MLANIFNSTSMNSTFGITFSYRKTRCYEEGLAVRVHRSISKYPLRLIEPSDIGNLKIKKTGLFRRVLVAAVRSVLVYPALLWNIVVLYFLFRHIRPNVLHINNGGYPGALSPRAAAVASSFLQTKIIMVVNNMAVGYEKPTRWLEYPLDLIVRARVDHFITGSTAASKQLSDVLKPSVKKMRVIPNGFDSNLLLTDALKTRSKLGISDASTVVLGVIAVLEPRKGHRVLLEAVHSLVREEKVSSNSFKVFIKGDGSLLGELTRYVELYQLDKYVKFHPHENFVYDFMYALDIIILPSIANEDFPNVVVEAMALSKPVIGTRVAGIPEQIEDGKTGYLVQPGDASALSNAIYALYTNRSLRKKMGEAAYKRYRDNYRISIVLKKYAHLYS